MSVVAGPVDPDESVVSVVAGPVDPDESVVSVVAGPLGPDEVDDPCGGAPKSTVPTKSCVTLASNLIVGIFFKVLPVPRANLKVTMHNVFFGSWDLVVRVNVPSFWSQDAFEVM